MTRALLPGSLAIDAGTAAGLATDQRGVPRPQGAASDIGAFELVPLAPTPAPTPVPTPAPKPAPAKPGPIQSPVSSFFVLKRNGTEVVELMVSQVPVGAKVRALCTGKGCPFKRKTVKVEHSKANVRTLFKRRALRPKSVIAVELTAPGRIGKVVRFAIRKGGLPRVQVLCLPIGSSTPKRHC